MSSLNEILENELENAFEVKDKKSLHRYVSFLSDSFVRKEDHSEQYNGLRSDIKVIVESIKEGFRRMDERFAAVDRRFESADQRFEESQKSIDKRFEDMQKHFDKRFNMMFTFMMICFSVIAIMINFR